MLAIGTCLICDYLWQQKEKLLKVRWVKIENWPLSKIREYNIYVDECPGPTITTVYGFYIDSKVCPNCGFDGLIKAKKEDKYQCINCGWKEKEAGEKAEKQP